MEKFHSLSEKSFRKETIFQIMYIVYPSLALVGTLGNLMTIVILWRGNCGLSKRITHYLVAMAAADLLVVLSDVMLTRMNSLFYPVCFLDLTVVCSLLTAVLCVAADSSAWLTAAFTWDRFLAICRPGAGGGAGPERTPGAVIGAIWALSCVSNAPWYLMYEPWVVIGNVSWFCKTKDSVYTSQAWAAFHWVDITLTPFAPFALIITLNVLTVQQILVASRIRRKLVTHSPDQGKILDPEAETRRKCVVLLFAISGSFLLLWTTYVVYVIYGQVFSYSYKGYNHPMYLLYQSAIMLQLLNSVTNTCVYTITQTRFREELNKAVKYPFILMIKVCKR